MRTRATSTVTGIVQLGARQGILTRAEEGGDGDPHERISRARGYVKPSDHLIAPAGH